MGNFVVPYECVFFLIENQQSLWYGRGPANPKSGPERIVTYLRLSNEYECLPVENFIGPAVLGRARVTALARRFGKRDVCAVAGHGCAGARALTLHGITSLDKRPHRSNNVFVLQPPSCPAHEAARISKRLSRRGSGGDEPVRSAIARTMNTRGRELNRIPPDCCYRRYQVYTAVRVPRPQHHGRIVRPSPGYVCVPRLRKRERLWINGESSYTHTHTHDNPSFAHIASPPSKQYYYYYYS